SEMLSEWIRQQLAETRRLDLINEDVLREESRRFLHLLRGSLKNGGSAMDIESSDWAEARSMLADLSRTRARLGFSPSQTATFVFSLKQPLFASIRKECGKDVDALAQETWFSNLLLDKLGLFTTEIYQKSREEVIARQQQEMLELSTPVVELWEGVLALP